MVPIAAYHFCMLADTERNVRYRRAIERAVGRRVARDGHCRVLDIGAGTGLLGLIAARAGATRVDCVEMHEVLHATATRVVAASGAHDARCWHALSTDLPIDPAGAAGPPARADLIVSEVLDTGLLGEGVLHTMRDATCRLLAPAGEVLPRGAAVYVMAIELRPPEVASELDLGCVERLRRGGGTYGCVRLHTVSHSRLSAPAEAMRFDFSAVAPGGDDGGDGGGAREVRLQLPATRRGRCNAIAWWFDLDLGDGEILSAAPGAKVRTWKQNVAYIEPPLDVARGGCVEALVWTSGDDQINVAGGRVGEARRPRDV